jgi:two-component system sensor histidine kinase DevS
MTQSPKILINFAVLTVAVFAFTMISVVRYSPYTGFMLEFDEASHSMMVVRLDGWVEEQGLELGDVIVSATNSNGMQVDIEAKHIIRSSAQARKLFSNRSERLVEIDRMHELFSHSPIMLTKADGTVSRLVLDQVRPLISVPFKFWVLFMIALTAPLVSSLVWAWQPKKPETTLLLVSGIGFFLTCFASATSINNIEMLYLPLFLHWLIRAALDVGQLMFAVFGTAVLLYYPNRLSYASKAFKSLLLGFFLYPFFAFFNSWSFSDLPSQIYPYFSDAEAYGAMFLVFGVTIILCRQQYRASKSHPVQRAQTLWVILAWTLGPGVFLSFYVLPRLLGVTPFIAGSVFLNLTILTTYLMILLGIARINLFHLEQHIGQAYQWVLISFLFIGVDVVLIAMVNLSPEVSSGILLAVVLWGYIPLRQWAKSRLSAGKRGRNQGLTSEALVLMVKNSLDPKISPDDSWRQIVNSLYRPGNTEIIEVEKKSSIEMRGQQLIVAKNHYSSALELEFAEGGSRLFVKRDLDLVGTLSVLFEKLYDVRDSFLAGQTQERDRIRRDLHDQIGHKLLSLIYAAGNDKSRSLAQETMAQLSELIQAMKQEPIQLDDLATRVHAVCEDICSNAKLKLGWKNEFPSGSIELISSDQFLNILNILRELLSNTIKHAGASCVQVSLKQENNFIVLGYSDDGVGFDQKNVRAGNGLFNLQSRAAELNAKMKWDTSVGTLFKLVIPLDIGDTNYG